MACLMKAFGAWVMAALLCGAVWLSSVPVQADSTVVDGPGFKVEKKRGWFGRESTVYRDALGNEVETKTGFFGRKSTKTRMFGSEVVKKGSDVQVTGPSGKPLVTTKKTLFRGKQTHVDGNGIWSSLKDLFQ